MASDPRGPVNSHDPFGEGYDHPMPFTDKRSHGDIEVCANIMPGERLFLEMGEEGGAD